MRELNLALTRIPTGQVPDTAEECFTLAAAALVQAEKAIDESFSGDVVTAVVAIANGWTALGRGLLDAPPARYALGRDQEPTPVFEATNGDLFDPPRPAHNIDAGGACDYPGCGWDSDLNRVHGQ